MTEFVKVATTEQISEGKIKGFSINGKKLLIANINGKYYSMCSVCTHKGGPLEDGEFYGKIITCPWHGAKFDVTTGKVISGPTKEDEKDYEIKVQGKDILVKI